MERSAYSLVQLYRGKEGIARCNQAVSMSRDSEFYTVLSVKESQYLPGSEPLVETYSGKLFLGRERDHAGYAGPEPPMLHFPAMVYQPAYRGTPQRAVEASEGELQVDMLLRARVPAKSFVALHND